MITNYKCQKKYRGFWLTEHERQILLQKKTPNKKHVDALACSSKADCLLIIRDMKLVKVLQEKYLSKSLS